MKILIYRELGHHAKLYSQDLQMRLLKYAKYINHKQILRGGQSIIVNDDIFIDFRFGMREKMAGLRPDYYNTDSYEASEYLHSQCYIYGGHELNTMNDVEQLIADYLMKGKCDI